MVLRKHLSDFSGRNGTIEKVALDLIAASLRNDAQLVDCLDALDDDRPNSCTWSAYVCIWLWA